MPLDSSEKNTWANEYWSLVSFGDYVFHISFDVRNQINLYHIADDTYYAYKRTPSECIKRLTTVENSQDLVWCACKEQLLLTLSLEPDYDVDEQCIENNKKRKSM